LFLFPRFASVKQIQHVHLSESRISKERVISENDDGIPV